MPCAYCYLAMYHEPIDSPYRGGSGSINGAGSAFCGTTHDIARLAQVVKAGAAIAECLFFKNPILGHTPIDSINAVSQKDASKVHSLNRADEILLAVYWDSWRQLNGNAFGQWWAEQEPRTEPAVRAVAENWDLTNISFPE
ncbi:Checkpoint protein hus1 [Sporothrix epigloea]|uniref:Checkpoint protein hus1 n=1 Tax=Sporothrix epigloea TaxID=1892477 RepID=A0ABP0DYI2_9PEZI